MRAPAAIFALAENVHPGNIVAVDYKGFDGEANGRLEIKNGAGQSQSASVTKSFNSKGAGTFESEPLSKTTPPGRYSVTLTGDSKGSSASTTITVVGDAPPPVEKKPAVSRFDSAPLYPGSTFKLKYSGFYGERGALQANVFVKDMKTGQVQGRPVIFLQGSPDGDVDPLTLPEKIKPGAYVVFMVHPPHLSASTAIEVHKKPQSPSSPPAITVLSPQPASPGSALSLQYAGFNEQAKGTLSLVCYDSMSEPRLEQGPWSLINNEPLQGSGRLEATLPATFREGVICDVTLTGNGEPERSATASLRVKARDAVAPPGGPTPPTPPGPGGSLPAKPCDPNIADMYQRGCVPAAAPTPATPTSPQPCDPNMPRYSQPGCIESAAPAPTAPAAPKPCVNGVPRYAQPGCID